MRARIASLAALFAALALAPAAHGANFVVANESDAGAGSLRQALLDANANGESDTITFAAAVDTIEVGSMLLADDPGFAVAITGPVVLRWTGPGSEPLLRFAAGSSGSSITDATIDGGGTAGIDVRDSGITIRRTRISGTSRYGVELNGNSAVITASPIFGNASSAIAESPVSAPSGLRVGPRSADGRLPVTGSTATGGTLELFRGNPAAATAIVLLASPTVPAGSFSHVLASEPQPGSALSATITSGGTSGFATATVPFDVQSPDLVGAVAISTNEVTLQFSEPLRADSVQLEDFALEMAGVARPVTALRIEPGGAQVTITSTAPWGHGEAGFVQLGAAGSLLDAGGNATLAATRARVAAAPGDLIPPVGSSLSIRPSSICLTGGRRCKRTGATVRFVGSEGGRAHLVLMRGNRRIGVDEALSDVGRNRIRFSGRLGNRKLRAGRYRMLLYLEDAVGNMTVEPPLQLFTVRRSTP